MKPMNRRHFIKTGAFGLAGFTVLQNGTANVDLISQQSVMVDKVKLGNTGLTVPRLAMGTGTIGGRSASNQTRLGMDEFKRLALHAYDRGMRFYDMAEVYGSMPFVGESIKTLPRENLTLLTKVSIPEDQANRKISVSETLDRFRQQIGTDYIDVFLMHYITAGGWEKPRTGYIDDYLKAKQDGIVKAVGISCHHIDALREAAVSRWVDVIMVRLNPFGTNMDDTPEEVNKALAVAKSNGKGIINMKVFGEGKHVTDDEREKSLQFVLKEGNVHCLTLGLESIGQMDDAINRTMRIVS